MYTRSHSICIRHSAIEIEFAIMICVFKTNNWAGNYDIDDRG